MKILILILTLFKISPKNATVISGVFLVDYYHSQSYTSGGNTGNNSWSVYQVNSPNNTYGDRYNCVNINRDSIVLRTKYIMMDSISNYNYTVTPNAKIAWLDGRQMKVSKIDSLPLTARQITIGLGYVPISNGSPIVLSVNTRTGSVIINGSDITSGLGYTPYNTSNPDGYINIVTTNQVTAALTYMPLQAEVDGSITNEIQLLSGSGTNLITLSNGGGLFTIPTQTTALTSAAINSALGYVPLSVEVDGSISNEIQSLSLNVNTLTISGGNSVSLPVSTFTAISAGTGISIASGTIITNSNPDQTVVLTQGANISISGTYPTFTIGSSFTYNERTVAFATAYQPSITRPTEVDVNVQIASSLSLSGGQSGTTILEVSPNGSTGWVTKRTVTNFNTGTLTIGLNTVQTYAAAINYVIPTGYYYRITNTGASTFTILNQSLEIQR